MSAYKLRRGASGQASLSVPPEVAGLIPDGMRFECDLIEDGILYRPVKATTVSGLPSWLGASPPPGGAVEVEGA